MSTKPHHFNLSPLPSAEAKSLISVLKIAAAIVHEDGDSVPQRLVLRLVATK